MQYINHYHSPLGDILLACDEIGLTGLWFENQRYYALQLDEDHEERDTLIFSETKDWLDIYFSGKKPEFTPPLHIQGSQFHKEVSEIMLSIPYGSTMTYGDIAAKIAEQRGIEKVSPRAVGGAVGHNAISIIVPCHRVVGANKNLTGYAGGIQRKIKLLELEGLDISKFSIPKK